MSLLHRCEEAYGALSPFRRMRRRCKDFAYGRQWGDSYRLPSGRVVAEQEQLLNSGRMPITNNLIRQLVKSIVGRYRFLSASRREEGSEADVAGVLDFIRENDNVDARTLEEFLISGCAFQRVEGSGEPRQRNISPERLIAGRFSEADASDACLLGMLHDLPESEVLRRFGGSDPRRLAEVQRVCRLGRDRVPMALGTEPRGMDFHRTGDPDFCRVVEVWTREWEPVLECRDPELGGRAVRGECTEMNRLRLDRLNAERLREGREPLSFSAEIQLSWKETWLAPTGEVLKREVHPASAQPPLLLGFYPMIDGEVHSLVEDVIGQQKYVNRLVTLMDDVLSSSAKGAVLFPTDQLPEGLSWRDLRELWSSPASIIPFRRTSKTVMPTQIHSSGNSAGASEMLKMQLRLFDEISGSTEAVRNAGRSATGADMLRQQMESATISMLDLLGAFRAFVSRRDKYLSDNNINK